MSIRYRGLFVAGLAAATFLSLMSTGSAQLLRRHRRVPVASGPVTEKEALETGVEAYIYGYPLVTVEMTRRVMTNVATPEGTHAPMGQFTNLREYPTAAFKDVTAPNADTLYSVAWLDLAKEPYILSLPDEDGRYYLMPMLSGWTDVFQVPGKRTTGTGPRNMQSLVPAGKVSCPKASRNTNPRRTWCGLLVGPIAPAHRRTTRRSMLSKISIPSFR